VSFAVSDAVSEVLHTALNGLTMRQNVTANNIANIDTPNFRATSIDFESSLREAIDGGQVTDNVMPTVNVSTTPTDTPVGANGNNVDLRKEEVALIQTQYQYQVLGQAIGDHYKLMQQAAVQP
jgi:flagellar basal-body rod protein FlgB